MPKFMGSKKIFYIRKESNSHTICLEHQYRRRFIVLEYQHGRRDVMWKRSDKYRQGYFQILFLGSYF